MTGPEVIDAAVVLARVALTAAIAGCLLWGMTLLGDAPPSGDHVVEPGPRDAQGTPDQDQTDAANRDHS